MVSTRPSGARASRGARQRGPVVLAALAALLALVAGGLYVLDPKPAPADTAGPRTAAAPGLPYPEVPRITVEEAKALLDARTAIFVDVRGAADYAFGHVPGAVSMPLPEIEARYTALPRAATIVTYCT